MPSIHRSRTPDILMAGTCQHSYRTHDHHLHQLSPIPLSIPITATPRFSLVTLADHAHSEYDLMPQCVMFPISGTEALGIPGTPYLILPSFRFRAAFGRADRAAEQSFGAIQEGGLARQPQCSSIASCRKPTRQTAQDQPESPIRQVLNRILTGELGSRAPIRHVHCNPRSYGLPGRLICDRYYCG